MSNAKNSSSFKKRRKLRLFLPNSDLKQFGQAHCHMTDKSLVVQTLLFFFSPFPGQQKKQVRKTRQMEVNPKDSKQGKETGNGLAEKRRW